MLWLILIACACADDTQEATGAPPDSATVRTAPPASATPTQTMNELRERLIMTEQKLDESTAELARLIEELKRAGMIDASPTQTAPPAPEPRVIRAPPRAVLTPTATAATD